MPTVELADVVGGGSTTDDQRSMGRYFRCAVCLESIAKVGQIMQAAPELNDLGIRFIVSFIWGRHG